MKTKPSFGRVHIRKGTDPGGSSNPFIYPVAVTGLTNGIHDVGILVRGTRYAKPVKEQVVFDGVTMP